MKKILTVCAALLAAFSLNAEITNMTCAEAYAAATALDPGATGTDSVAVTGYITTTDGNLSRGQQKFWMDDQKGSVQTLQGYWCNLPAEDVENARPLNVGDKIILRGFLMNYNGTAEIKNGDVEILERVAIVIDTIPATVCEAIEEALSLTSGDNTTDVFQVTGIVSSLGQTNDTYHTQTFFMTSEECEASLQAYSVTMDGDYANVGDTVFCQGRLINYNGQAEINGDARVIGKAPVYIPDTIEVDVISATEYGFGLGRGQYSQDIFVVTGYVDSIVTPYDTAYHNLSFFMCANMANPTYQFEAYRCYFDRDILVGSLVKVTGLIKNYFNTTDSVTIIEIEKGEIELISEPVEGLEDVMTEGKAAEKRLINGQLFIIREDAIYDAKGMQVK